MKKPSMIANPAKLAQVVDAEPRWKATFISRIVILLCDFLAIILAAAVPTRQGYVLAWSYIPLGVSFIWCLANIIVRLRRPRPMHPGANVAMDLLMFVQYAVLMVMLANVRSQMDGVFRGSFLPVVLDLVCVQSRYQLLLGLL